MLELWKMRSTPLLPSLPGPLWPRVLATWLVPRDFRYRGNIKDAVSLKHGEAGAEVEKAAEKSSQTLF